MAAQNLPRSTLLEGSIMDIPSVSSLPLDGVGNGAAVAPAQGRVIESAASVAAPPPVLTKGWRQS